MRKLNAGDLFKAARMIKRMGIKEDLKNFSENLDKDATQEGVGFDLLMLIMEKATEEGTEKLIYEFLAGPFMKTPDEVENMDLFEMVETLFKVADVEKWKGALQKLFSKERGMKGLIFLGICGIALI